MKSKFIVLLVLIALFALFVAIRFFILDSQNQFGNLKVISSPTASIFIDNVNAGKTPFKDKYKIGEYMLKLIPEGAATETASWQGKIKIYKNSLTYINRELGSSDVASAGEIFTVTKMEKRPSNSNFGEIYVETEPQGAIVYLDNEEKGIAPLILGDVLKDEHEISVFLPGFLRRTQKINIDPFYRVNASFKLAIDQLQAPAVKKNEATPSASVKKTQVTIKETPTGWLRVREEASLNASEAAKVKPGESYELLEEREGWYKIEYEKGKIGWISSEYSTASSR